MLKNKTVALIVMIFATHSIALLAEESKFGPGTHLGFGFVTSGTVAGPDSPALSLWLDLNGDHALQAIGQYGSTSNKSWGAGLQYKYSLFKTNLSAFFLGAGVGTAHSSNQGDTPEGLMVSGLVGFRFSLPPLPNLQLSLEGGPIYDTNSGSGISGTLTNSRIAAVSPALGLQIHYLF